MATADFETLNETLDRVMKEDRQRERKARRKRIISKLKKMVKW